MFKFIFNLYTKEKEFSRVARLLIIVMCVGAFLCLADLMYLDKRDVNDAWQKHYDYTAWNHKCTLDKHCPLSSSYDVADYLIVELPTDKFHCELFLFAHINLLDVYSKELKVNKKNLSNICILGRDVELKLKTGDPYGET